MRNRVDKGAIMTIDSVNNWPLIVVPSPENKALQKETALHLPSQDHQRPVILDNQTDRESDIFWEKGTFINIYIDLVL